MSAAKRRAKAIKRRQWVQEAADRRAAKVPCPVTGESPCPYHPDDMNHPEAAQ